MRKSSNVLFTIGAVVTIFLGLLLLIIGCSLLEYSGYDSYREYELDLMEPIFSGIVMIISAILGISLRIRLIQDHKVAAGVITMLFFVVPFGIISGIMLFVEEKEESIELRSLSLKRQASQANVLTSKPTYNPTASRLEETRSWFKDLKTITERKEQGLVSQGDYNLQKEALIKMIKARYKDLTVLKKNTQERRNRGFLTEKDYENSMHYIRVELGLIQVELAKYEASESDVAESPKKESLDVVEEKVITKVEESLPKEEEMAKPIEPILPVVEDIPNSVAMDTIPMEESIMEEPKEEAPKSSGLIDSIPVLEEVLSNNPNTDTSLYERYKHYYELDILSEEEYIQKLKDLIDRL